MTGGQFATSICCMDGRIQTVLSEWIRQNHDVEYVDTITAPGVDKRVAEESDTKPLIDMARISIQKHGSRLIILSGHHDCAGNPVTEREHADHIKAGVRVIKSWHGLADETKDSIEVIGLWVDDAWTVQRIA